MDIKLREAVKKLILGEIKRLLDEFRQVRSLRLSENEDSTRSEYLSQRVELARQKLEDLRRLKQREKEVRDRRRKIDQDNAKGH